MSGQDNIGALWKPKSDNPKAPFAKGSIEIAGRKIQIVIWKNGRKQEDKHPDYQITLDKPRDENAPRGRSEPWIPRMPNQDEFDDTNPPF